MKFLDVTDDNVVVVEGRESLEFNHTAESQSHKQGDMLGCLPGIEASLVSFTMIFPNFAFRRDSRDQGNRSIIW